MRIYGADIEARESIFPTIIRSIFHWSIFTRTATDNINSTVPMRNADRARDT